MFKGLGTALITPFKENQEIDYESFQKLVDFQTKSGVDYLLIAGTTGEAPTLENEEIIKLLEVSKNISSKNIMLGISGNSSKRVIDTINYYNNNKNISSFLISSPYYNKPNQDGIYEHFYQISKISKKPIVLYNIPGRTASLIKIETIIKLVNNTNNIKGIKDAVGDFDFSMNLCQNIKNQGISDFDLLSGDDTNIISLMSLGYIGAISVTSNEIPNIIKKMIDFCNNNDFKNARNIHYQNLELMNANFIETNPLCVKYIMSKLGYCKNSFRLPLVKINKIDNINYLDKIFLKYFN